MANFPALYEPKNWNDVKFQPVAVRTIQRWLKEEDYPSYLFVEGGSGCGKTSSIRLLIKTVHCLNRRPRETQPCGHCVICKGDPIEQNEINNVVWVKPSSLETADGVASYESQIKQALLLAERGPRITGANHRDILFVVFDEAHLMPDSLRQRAMVFADALNPSQGRVVLVFNTMEPQKIREEPRKALRSRGGWLQFNRPTEAQVRQFLLETFPSLSINAASLLAEVADRSLRSALSCYKTVYDYDKHVTADSVAEVFRLSKPSERQQLWQLIENNSPTSKIKAYLDELSATCDYHQIMLSLWKDIEASLSKITEQDYILALELFSTYLRNPHTINAQYLLTQLRGRKIVDHSIFEESYDDIYTLLTEPDPTWATLPS